jgi:hypothetical protein
MNALLGKANMRAGAEEREFNKNLVLMVFSLNSPGYTQMSLCLSYFPLYRACLKT